MTEFFNSNIEYIKNLIRWYSYFDSLKINDISNSTGIPIQEGYLINFTHSIVLYKDSENEIIISTPYYNGPIFLFYMQNDEVKLYLNPLTQSDKTILVLDNAQISKFCESVNDIKFYDKDNKDLKIEVDLEITEEEHFMNLMKLNIPDYDKVLLGIEIHKNLYKDCSTVCNAIISYSTFDVELNKIDLSVLSNLKPIIV